MLFADIINIDGSIDINKASSVKKDNLWSYIYYLYHFNQKNEKTEIFLKMRSEKNGKANATRFYDAVTATVASDMNSKNIKPVPAFDENTLIYFINIVVHKYDKVLINPVIEYLNKILSKEIIPTLGSLAIKTGPTSGKNVTIITDPSKLANANVKVNFSLSPGK